MTTDAVPRPNVETIREMVRAYMRDHSELNRLLSGQETGDRLLDTCIMMAVDYFNTSHAPISATVSSFPSLKLLVMLTICEVLESVMLLKARNNLVYSDSGFTVNNEANIQLYESLLNRFRAHAEAMMDRLKVSLNIMQSFGTDVSSEYGVLSGWVTDYYSN